MALQFWLVVGLVVAVLLCYACFRRIQREQPNSPTRKPHLTSNNSASSSTTRKRATITTNEFICAHSVELAPQCVLTPPSERAKKTFHKFIQDIVRLFNFQRQKGYQFAVLLVNSQYIFASENNYFQFKTRDGVVDSRKKATDSSQPTFPQDDKIFNYIVARPDSIYRYISKKYLIKYWEGQVYGPHHAEAQLMKKLDKLLKSYGKERCKTIVLYTWLLPCSYCCKKIIKELRRVQAECIIVYTSKMQDVTDGQEKKIVKDLEGAGIHVKNESYNQKLQTMD